jgi:hypothetical protein
MAGGWACGRIRSGVEMCVQTHAGVRVVLHFLTCAACLERAHRCARRTKVAEGQTCFSSSSLCTSTRRICSRSCRQKFSKLLCIVTFYTQCTDIEYTMLYIPYMHCVRYLVFPTIDAGKGTDVAERLSNVFLSVLLHAGGVRVEGRQQPS